MRLAIGMSFNPLDGCSRYRLVWRLIGAPKNVPNQIRVYQLELRGIVVDASRKRAVVVAVLYSDWLVNFENSGKMLLLRLV